MPGNIASIWSDLISTPLLTYFAWSPLIELAFDVNRDLFLPPSSLASTPYLSSLPYDTSAPTTFTTTNNVVRYPRIPGLMAIHVRQGDYSTHCTTLGSLGDPFISVNSFPSLPDQLVPPGNPTSHGKLPVEWTGSPEQLEYHHRRCFPSIPEIVAKVLEVRSAPVGAGVRRIHIMTNGKPPYIAELKSALKDAAEWDSISSSRDLVLNWEQKFVSQAVDVLVAQRAQVIIGNGVSVSTSLGSRVQTG